MIEIPANLARLSDIEDRALDAYAPGLHHYEQLTEARRRITQGAQWLAFARRTAEGTDAAVVVTEARRHLIAAQKLIDPEITR